MIYYSTIWKGRSSCLIQYLHEAARVVPFINYHLSTQSENIFSTCNINLSREYEEILALLEPV